MKRFNFIYLLIIIILNISDCLRGQIVFYSMRDGNAEIYTINTDGSNLTRLTNNNSDDGSPAWFPDGLKIVFSSTRDGNRNLYVMNSDGSDQNRISTSPAYESHPDISPDGNKIAFTSERDGNSEIYIMNLDGTDLLRLTNDPAEDIRPDWSPDGKTILFNSNRDGNWDIYSIDITSNKLTKKTFSPSWELFPTFSPDGQTIAFYLATPNQWDQEIYTMNIDGSNLQQLTNLSSGISENPSWSANGDHIVFQSDRDGNFEIYIMEDDGGNQQRITNNSAGDFWPSCKQEVSTSNEISTPEPRDFQLQQNYPNPFNPSTKISFQIPELSFVSLKVYDVLGNAIAILADENIPAGNYVVKFDGTGLPSGVYICKLQTVDFTDTKKMLLLK